MMDTDCVLCELRTEILLLKGGLYTYPGPIIVGFGGQSSNWSTSVPRRHYQSNMLIFVFIFVWLLWQKRAVGGCEY
jgi:hypothetical protein